MSRVQSPAGIVMPACAPVAAANRAAATATFNFVFIRISKNVVFTTCVRILLAWMSVQNAQPSELPRIRSKHFQEGQCNFCKCGTLGASEYVKLLSASLVCCGFATIWLLCTNEKERFYRAIQIKFTQKFLLAWQCFTLLSAIRFLFILTISRGST